MTRLRVVEIGNGPSAAGELCTILYLDELDQTTGFSCV